MKLLAEGCWAGGDTFATRYTVQTGRLKGLRLTFTSDGGHSRWLASLVRDHLQRHYAVKRNSVRIKVL